MRESVKDPILELVRKCPILSDKNFQERYPGILNVSVFIDESAKTYEQIGKDYTFFNRLGVSEILGYLNLMRKGDIGAVRSYKSVRDTFGFS
ncbi:MAG: hypothetical protein AABX11_02235 [Nanoarchaeota archaeon]